MAEADDRTADAIAATARPLLRFDNVSKRFGDFTAVDRLSLSINRGEFFALLGPSGCGKTTLLRLVAGFETPSEGRMLLDEQDIGATPPHLRPVNMMFQNYALFPHMTVEGNIAFGLKQERLPKNIIQERVAEMLALVRLEPWAKRKPNQLSGGQRQRAALARSLVKRPKVLLLDEPLAALDKKLREETQFELIQLQKRLATTFVIVTHDQQEAMTVATRMAVMEHGGIAQVGTPVEIYEQPNSRYVADFIGDVNLLQGRITGTSPGGVTVECDELGNVLVTQAATSRPGDDVWVALRPEKMRIDRDGPAGNLTNSIGGSVVEIGYLGDLSTYKVRVSDRLVLKATVPNLTRTRARPLEAGDRVRLSWAADSPVVLTH